MSEILSGAWNAARPHAQDRVVLSAPIHAAFCEIRERAALERRHRIRVRLVQTAAEHFFGKTCENLRKRVNARLVSDPKTIVTAAGKATFKRSTSINFDLVFVESTRPRIMMNRPLAFGFTILELSKLVTYSAYYEQLLPRYGDDLRLCFTDTYTFIFWVKTPDLQADVSDMRSSFLDTSNFPPGRPIYSDKNKRKLGFFKSSTGPYFPSQFCGLRSKMYSLSLSFWTPTSHDPAHTFTKAIGVPKHYIKKMGATRKVPARVERVEHHVVHYSDLQIEKPRHHHSQTGKNMSVRYRRQTVLAIGRHNVVAVRSQRHSQAPRWCGCARSRVRREGACTPVV